MPQLTANPTTMDGVVKLLQSPMSQLVYTGSLDGNVRAWDGCTGNCECTYQGHKDSILDLPAQNVFVGNSLVDMYAKCGSMEDAWSSTKCHLKMWSLGTP
jgi:WD40 repeat protein